MDCFALEQGLRAASARVIDGQRALLSQRCQIRELEQCGFDASLARALLGTYEQSQAMALFDRNRFASALATATAFAPSSVNDDEYGSFVDIEFLCRQAA